MTNSIQSSSHPAMMQETCFETCTRKLQELIHKIKEIFLTVLQTLCPCFFRREAPVDLRDEQVRRIDEEARLRNEELQRREEEHQEWLRQSNERVRQNDERIQELTRQYYK